MHTQLDRLGWNDHHQASLDRLESPGLVPGRVAVEHRSAFVLYTESGELWGRLSGRLRRQGEGDGHKPTVGDWVALRPKPGDPAATIHHLLPRTSYLSRNVAGSNTVKQVLAANIDTAFIVSSLDGDLNSRRLERYITMTWAGGVEPVIVLTKSDLCDDPLPDINGLGPLVAGVSMHVTSSVTGRGVDGLRRYFDGYKTVALVGSSGAGKSSLVNALAGRSLQAVALLATTARGGTRPRDANWSCSVMTAGSWTHRG